MPYTTALHSSKEGANRALHNCLKQFKGRGPTEFYTTALHSSKEWAIRALHNCHTQFKGRGQ